MSTQPYEGMPYPDTEKELQVSPDEARIEVADTVESIIISSLDRAQELSVGGISELAEAIKSGEELSEEQLALLSQRGHRLLRAISNLRTKKDLLTSGLRQDLTNEERVKIVDQLHSYNQFWKDYVADDNMISDAESLIKVVENTAYGIRIKALVVGDKSMLTKEAGKQIEQSQS